VLRLRNVAAGRRRVPSGSLSFANITFNCLDVCGMSAETLRLHQRPLQMRGRSMPPRLGEDGRALTNCTVAFLLQLSKIMEKLSKGSRIELDTDRNDYLAAMGQPRLACWAWVPAVALG
jgi:hypothetical protein